MLQEIFESPSWKIYFLSLTHFVHDTIFILQHYCCVGKAAPLLQYYRYTPMIFLAGSVLKLIIKLSLRPTLKFIPVLTLSDTLDNIHTYGRTHISPFLLIHTALDSFFYSYFYTDWPTLLLILVHISIFYTPLGLISIHLPIHTWTQTHSYLQTYIYIQSYKYSYS